MVPWLPPPWNVHHYAPVETPLRDGETLLIVTGRGNGTVDEAMATKRLIENAGPLAGALQAILEEWFPCANNDERLRPGIHAARKLLAEIRGDAP